MKYCCRLFFLIFILFSSHAYAWNRSIELGYGSSKDPNNSQYRNSGFLLSSDIQTICETSYTHWTLMASLGQWSSTTTDNNELTTLALSLGLRVFPLDLVYPAYLFGSAGPAYISDKTFGVNTQASHVTIQSSLGLGVEMGHFDLNLRWQHYSNANIGEPNEGFNILYVGSLGYLF